MIELTDYRGNKVLIHSKDIREVSGYFDQRYPSIQSVIILYDGKKIECSHPYDVVKNLTIPRVSNSLPTLTEINEKATHYTDVECSLQNFEDEATLIIERMRYCHGYIRAIKDFVSDSYEPE